MKPAVVTRYREALAQTSGPRSVGALYHAGVADHAR
jgi:hypothetical protein